MPSIAHLLTLHLTSTYTSCRPPPPPSLRIGTNVKGWKIRRRVGKRVYIAKKGGRSYSLILLPHSPPCGTLPLLTYLSTFPSPPISLTPLTSTSTHTILLSKILGPSLTDIFEGKLFLDLNICIKVWEDVKGILGRLKSLGIRHGGVGGKVIRLTWRGGETRATLVDFRSSLPLTSTRCVSCKCDLRSLALTVLEVLVGTRIFFKYLNERLKGNKGAWRNVEEAGRVFRGEQCRGFMEGLGEVLC
ncbi:hypothetical protein TrVE_jg2522 [Triparma verrucosa]|uniref:Non-specific serine/threonine protein kinase n=1 Tax=Triparma verrucosa TaxID=1606542 RepID=A0A9W7CFU4_9STRA|nr:hypothetical protein TrVE_jg2522 [Triparma verrucosa]